MTTHYGLDGRVAIVTGASAGLGEQFAHGLAASGADLVLAARRTELVERVAAEVGERHGVRALPVTADVSREADVVAMVRPPCASSAASTCSSTTPAR